MSQKLISTLISIAILCQLSQQNETTESNKQLLNETYSKCNSTNSMICLGMETGCVSKKNCEVLLTATPLQNSTNFMMFWNRESQSYSRWVGAALSEDRRMGDDSVTECILDKNNTVIVRQGLTSSGGVQTVEQVRGITKEFGSFSDKIVFCSWSRADDTMVMNLDFNIVNKKYYVFLAYGPVTPNDQPSYHLRVWTSERSEYFAKDISSNSTTITPKPTSP